MPDALPGTTLPIYLGLGQAPSWLGYPMAWLSVDVFQIKIEGK